MDSSWEGNINIREEIHRLELYLTSEKSRFAKNLEFDFQISSSLREHNPRTLATLVRKNKLQIIELLNEEGEVQGTVASLIIYLH